MSAILILLAISLLIATGFLVAFVYSAKTGQFDDDYSPKEKILF